MATTIKLKNGSGAPLAADLVQGEVALDLTNKRIYTENASGTVIELGTSPSTIDINAGTIDGTVIGGASAAAGTFTTATATTGNITTVNATTVDSTNLEVTNIKAKDGTSAGSIADSTGVVTLASSVLTTADINGGTIDGVTIGGASAGAGTFTTGQFNTSLNVDGTVTADGLTVDGSVTQSGITCQIFLDETDATDLNTYLRSGSNGQFSILTINDAHNSSTTRFMINHSTGDISFYEDTGTTPKFFWDASEERLGVATASPDSSLHVDDIQSYPITLTRNGGSDSNTAIRWKQATTSWYAGVNSSNSFVFKYNSSDFSSGNDLVITSAGNVGIGTTSPDAKIRTTNATAGLTAARFSGVSGALIVDYNGGSTNYYDGNTQIFRNGAGSSDYMRIDSSGNLLFDTTDTSPHNNSGSTSGGIVLHNEDYLSIGRASGAAMFINRQQNDGDIIDFRKDGTTVGSIGAVTLAGATNLIIDAPNAVYFGTNARPETDNASDLGSASFRWQDLYLSGGVYLGGTVAANLLDDYEEGTFTPVVRGSSTAGTYELSTAEGIYTKIGRQVTINVQVALAGTITGGGSGGLRISGLPFNPSDDYNHGAVRMSGVDVDNSTITLCASTDGSNRVIFLETFDNASNGSCAIADVSASDIISFTLTYKTTA